MKISLLYPKWTSEYGIFGHFAKSSTCPPLILTYIAALAERDGHQVQIVDSEIENLTIEQTVEKVKDYGPDLIGITSTTPFFHMATETAKALKKALPEIPTVIGGHHITVTGKESFLPCFDYAFIGEAEISWPEFLKKISNGESPIDVKGILYRKGDEVIFTGDATRLENMDTLPKPSRHLLKNELYTIGTPVGRKQFTTIYTIWGCPFRCIFCCTGAFLGKKMRKRNPELVIEEIKHVIKEYGTTHFMFMDDTLTMDRKHIVDVCNLIIKENLNITFEGSTRANLLDEELVSILKKAGLVRLSFGLEAVNEKIRKIMRKEVPLQAYIDSNKLTNKYGIETLNSCMIGLPGETHETLEQTLDFLSNQDEIKQANLSIAVPYPGTELYKMAKQGEHGLKLMTEDWSKYRRYNAAVMTVGDLTPKDLIEMQNYGFLTIYTAPWRLKPMLRRAGWQSLVLMSIRFVKYLWCLVKGSKNVTTRVLTRKGYKKHHETNESIHCGS